MRNLACLLEAREDSRSRKRAVSLLFPEVFHLKAPDPYLAKMMRPVKNVK